MEKHQTLTERIANDIYEIARNSRMQIPCVQDLIPIINAKYSNDYPSDSTIYRARKKAEERIRKELNDSLQVLLREETIELYSTYKQPIIIKINPTKILLVEHYLLNLFKGKIVTVPSYNLLIVYILKKKKDDSSDESTKKTTDATNYYKKIKKEIKNCLSATVTYASESQQK